MLAGEFLESLTDSNHPASSVSESVRDLSHYTVSREGDRDCRLRATLLSLTDFSLFLRAVSVSVPHLSRSTLSPKGDPAIGL